MRISNIRIEETDEWARLVVDIDSDSKRYDKESTIWIGVEKDNRWMLSKETYNCFLFLPLYMAMYYHENLHISGKVSKQLYRNINDYLKPIMLSFSKKLSDQKIEVDGFEEVTPSDKVIIGTGISCGVDCLQTVYQYYEKEKDPDYRINGLFMLNCGWHGDYYENKTYKLFMDRSAKNTAALKKLGGGGGGGDNPLSFKLQPPFLSSLA
ncbi:hypothetical protein AALC75_25145 [Lachnospiraceae bacterium 48-42]